MSEIIISDLYRLFYFPWNSKNVTLEELGKQSLDNNVVRRMLFVLRKRAHEDDVESGTDEEKIKKLTDTLVPFLKEYVIECTNRKQLYCHMPCFGSWFWFFYLRTIMSKIKEKYVYSGTSSFMKVLKNISCKTL